ncbi:MAG: nitroreductase family protein [Candidatus Aenigmatarchaeota archaeon]|nr:MAG: nitroreductase family protein [Candidatus Aenigmarchaeota archaeon]
MRNIDEIIRERRSIRVFSEKKVPWSLIEKIVEAGTWAPSACNLQRWEFVAITKDSLKREIYEKAKTQKLVLDAPVSIVALYDIRFTRENYANIQSLSAAIQNMILKAYELGLGSLWMASIKNPREHQKIVKADKNLFPFAIILLGYSSQKPNPPIRRSVKEVLHKNVFRGGALSTNISPYDWNENELKEFQQRYIRARSAKKWNSLNKHEKLLLEYFKTRFKTGKTLDVFSCPGFHLKYLKGMSDK